MSVPYRPTEIELRNAKSSFFPNIFKFESIHIISGDWERLVLSVGGETYRRQNVWPAGLRLKKYMEFLRLPGEQLAEVSDCFIVFATDLVIDEFFIQYSNGRKKMLIKKYYSVEENSRNSQNNTRNELTNKLSILKYKMTNVVVVFFSILNLPQIFDVC